MLGDQVFDAFAYCDNQDPLEDYTTSWKGQLPPSKFAVGDRRHHILRFYLPVCWSAWITSFHLGCTNRSDCTDECIESWASDAALDRLVLRIGRQDIENDLGIKHLIQNEGNPTPKLQRRYFCKSLGVPERSKWIAHDKPPSPESGNVTGGG